MTVEFIIPPASVWTGSVRLMTEPIPPRFVGWRCLHAAEGGPSNPVGMPNVRRSRNVASVPFSDALQELSYELMVRMNPSISHNEWMNVFDSGTAFCNRHGVETNQPMLMDGIICAGMFTTAQPEGTDLVMYPGIHAIDISAPLPTVDEILERGWYFVGNTGRGAHGAFHLPQGDQAPVYILYALREAARYPRAWFARWDSDRRPDALRYGG